MPPAGELTDAPVELTSDARVLWMGTFSNSDWLDVQGVPDWTSPTEDHVTRVAPSYPFPTPYVLHIEHEALGQNWESGAVTCARFSDMGIAGRSEAVLSYYLKFDTGFHFSSTATNTAVGTGVSNPADGLGGSDTHSGKLPGLAGCESAGSFDPPGGGTCIVETADGWSARMMYAEYASSTAEGRIGPYIYSGEDFDSNGLGGTCSGDDHGTNYKVTGPPRFVYDELIYVAQRIRLNTATTSPTGSIVETYIRNVTQDGDGMPALLDGKYDDVKFRTANCPNALINRYWIQCFPGGKYTLPGGHDYGMPVISTEVLPSYALTSPGSPAVVRRGRRRH